MKAAFDKKGILTPQPFILAIVGIFMFAAVIYISSLGEQYGQDLLTTAVIGTQGSYPEHFYLLDSSDSMSSTRLNIEKNAANSLIDSIVPPQGGVYKFHRTMTLLQGLTTSRTSLHTAVNSVKRESEAMSNFKTAINTATTQLISQGAACPAIILFSDGRYQNEQDRIDALAEAAVARSKGVAIYGIAIKPSSTTYSNFIKNLATDCTGNPNCGAFVALTGTTIGTKLEAMKTHMSNRCSSSYNLTKTAVIYRDVQYNPTPKLNESLPGDRIVYVVRVTTLGTKNLTNVVIKDVMPAIGKTTYLPGSARIRREGATDVLLTPVNYTITANIGTVKPGATQ